jgi:alpha-amylase
MPKTVCLYFKVHLPYSLKAYSKEQVGVNHCYEDSAADEVIINKLADECYLPSNRIILSNILNEENRFKLSYSISGTALELMQKYRPDVLTSFQDLVNTGSVELLAETYYSSLSFLYSKREFGRQLEKHNQLIRKLFRLQPQVFRNTELIYNNQLATFINELGYKGILCEGTQKILKGRSPNKLYASPGNGDLALLLRNTSLSDDIAFRFDDQSWNQFPLTAEKFAQWLHLHPPDAEVINLYLDYETFGIYKHRDTGIFEFLQALPAAVLENEDFVFDVPSGAIHEHFPRDIYNVPDIISWEDHSAACCIWSENTKQNNTLKKLYAMEKLVMQSENKTLLQSWGRLQATDYIHFMSDNNKNGCKHLNPYESAQEVYDYFTSILTDMEISLVNEQIRKNNMHFINQTNNLY